MIITIKKIIFYKKNTKYLVLFLCSLLLSQCGKSKATIELEANRIHNKGGQSLDQLNKKDFPILSNLPIIDIDIEGIKIERKTDEAFRTKDNEFTFTYKCPIESRNKIMWNGYELKLIEALKLDQERSNTYSAVYKGKKIIIKHYTPRICVAHVEKELQRHKKVNKLDENVKLELYKIAPKILNIVKDRANNIYIIMEHVEEDIKECCKDFYKWIKIMYEKLMKLHANNICHTDLAMVNFKGYRFIDFEEHKKEIGQFFFSGDRSSTLAVKDISGLARSLLYKYYTNPNFTDLQIMQDMSDITIQYHKVLQEMENKGNEKDINKEKKKAENKFIDHIKEVLDKHKLSTKYTNFLIKVAKGEIKTAKDVLKGLKKV